MIIKISSKNNYLLDILYKNPNTDGGLYFKTLKRGCIVGNAIDKHNYEVVFQDTKYSYAPDGSNQIDYQSYTSPLVIMNIFNALFSHILRAKEDFKSLKIDWLNKAAGDVDTDECKIEVPSFYIDSNWYQNNRFLLSKYFEGIVVEQQSECVFRLTITAPTIFEAMNLLAITALFVFLTNDYGMHIYIDEGLMQKYGRILTNIDNVPYFIFYLFNVRTIRSPRRFDEFKPLFESYLAKDGIVADLKPLSNAYQREQNVMEYLDTKIPILDIGCGEFTYYKRMKTKGLSAPYFGVDLDESFERLAQLVAQRYNDETMSFSTSLNDYDATEPVNILLIEVIEHNSLSDSKELIKKALSYNFNRLIITTPNGEFNQFYIMDTEFRHDDHCYELSAFEFKSLVTEVISEANFKDKVSLTYLEIGDKLNGITPTQGVVIERI